MSGKDSSSSSDSEEPIGDEELGAPSGESLREREGGGAKPKKNLRIPSRGEGESPSKKSRTSVSDSSQREQPVGHQVPPAQYASSPGTSSKAVDPDYRVIMDLHRQGVSAMQQKPQSPVKKLIGSVKKVFKPPSDALTDLEKRAKRIAKAQASRAAWEEIYGDVTQEDIKDPSTPPPSPSTSTPSLLLSEASTDVTSLYSSMEIPPAFATQGPSGEAAQEPSGDTAQGSSSDSEGKEDVDKN